MNDNQPVIDAIHDLRDDFLEAMKEFKQLIRELIDTVADRE